MFVCMVTMIATHDTLTEARSVSIQPKPGNNTDICLCAANNAHVSACTHVNLQLCVLSRDNLSFPNSRLLTAWTRSFLKMFNRNHFTCSEYKNTRNSCADSLYLSLSLCLALLDGFSLSLSHTLCQTDGRTNNRQTYRHTDAARNCGPQTQSRSPRTSEERRRKSKDNLSQKAICFGLLKSRRG